MPRGVGIVVLLALLEAGCGVRNNKPATAAGTAPCLQKKGFTGVTTAPAQIGFIASTAENGGLKATSPSSNIITIAFAPSSAYTRRHRSANELSLPRL